MALAFMQADESIKTSAAMATIVNDQDCNFDITMKGARLHLLKFHTHTGALNRNSTPNHSFIKQQLDKGPMVFAKRTLWSI